MRSMRCSLATTRSIVRLAFCILNRLRESLVRTVRESRGKFSVVQSAQWALLRIGMLFVRLIKAELACFSFR